MMKSDKFCSVLRVPFYTWATAESLQKPDIANESQHPHQSPNETRNTQHVSPPTKIIKGNFS
jgi:hypothetical protein